MLLEAAPELVDESALEAVSLWAEEPSVDSAVELVVDFAELGDDSSSLEAVVEVEPTACEDEVVVSGSPDDAPEESDELGLLD